MDEIENIKAIHIADFDYPLPDERIARHPLADRESCLLLAADDTGNISHHHFRDLPDLLSPGTEIFCNDTRVINARLEMHKSTGSRIEIFLLEPIAPADYALMFQARGECKWSCLVGNRKRWKGEILEKDVEIRGLGTVLSAELGEPREGNAFEVTFRWDNPALLWSDVIEGAGAIPIPPYLKRDSEETDYEDYQTVYARQQGSVAAPTAGLHFTDALISRLAEKGFPLHRVTLHVGAGTFQPVKSEEIGEHPMHTETFSITPGAVECLIAMLRERRPVTAVGTTTVRTLESIPYVARAIREAQDASLMPHDGTGKADRLPEVKQWEAYERPVEDPLKELEWLLLYMRENNLPQITAATSIMIAPGFHWNIVKAMITNFHQPQSTLLLLVSSFLGNDKEGNPFWRRYYDAALSGDYRFLSYGDACYFTHAKK